MAALTVDARVCAGFKCLPLSDATDWQRLLANKEQEKYESIGCPTRLRGCPWSSCRASRASLNTFCAPLGFDAPLPCRDRRHHGGLPNCHMILPSNTSKDTPERLRARQCSGSLGEEQYVLHRFFGGRDGKLRRGGVFFELGAFDGWQESNTLHLESCLGWRGVLMDAPARLEWLRTNRPGAVSVGLAACPVAGNVTYAIQKATTAGILSYMSRSVRRRFKVDGAGTHHVACGPLSGLFAQLGLRHIDVCNEPSDRLPVHCGTGMPYALAHASANSSTRARAAVFLTRRTGCRADGPELRRLARPERERSGHRVQGLVLPRYAGRGSPPPTHRRGGVAMGGDIPSEA